MNFPEVQPSPFPSCFHRVYHSKRSTDEDRKSGPGKGVRSPDHTLDGDIGTLSLPLSLPPSCSVVSSPPALCSHLDELFCTVEQQGQRITSRNPGNCEPRGACLSQAAGLGCHKGDKQRPVVSSHLSTEGTGPICSLIPVPAHMTLGLFLKKIKFMPWHKL